MRVSPHITAALAAVVASTTMALASGPPLPLSPDGHSHLSVNQKLARQIQTLDVRLSQVEDEASILNRCKVYAVVVDGTPYLSFQPNINCPVGPYGGTK